MSKTIRALLCSATILTPAYGFAQESSFSISGQVNRGVLFADDGQETDTFFVDNDNSSTRLRAIGETTVGDLTFGAEIEVEIESNSTADVSQLDSSVSADGFNERKLEVYAIGNFGKLSLGQGDTSSNSTSEVDLSGTSLVGYSSVSDAAGGLLFRETGGALSTVSVGSAFSNLDGLSRRDRIRYDTPSFAGFTLSASYGEDDLRDVALRYSGEFGGGTFSSALAFSELGGTERVNGSASFLHNTGLNFTVAGGQDDLDDASRDPEFGYFKVGYQTDSLMSFGTSAFSVDYYDGSDIAAAGDSSESYGVQFVQNFDQFNTEIYVGYRQYSYEDGATPVSDVDAILLGARYKF